MQFTKWHVVGTALLLSLGGLMIYGATYIHDYYRAQNDQPTDVERTLSVEGLTLEGGSTLDPSLFSGKVVVVTSWASWCPSCAQMLIDLTRAKERFGDAIEIIAVNRAEEQRVIDDYRVAMRIPEGITYITDNEDKYFAAISGRSMPEFIFYTREGAIFEHRGDAPSFDSLMTTLETLTNR